MSNYFKGKTAVVTGAASGFGLGISERLLALGAKHVWMADFNEAQLGKEAARLAERYGDKVTPITANSMKREEVEGVIDRAAAEDGQLDFVFNNAGRPMTKPTEQIDPKEFEDLVQLNYLGVVYGVLAALKYMLPQKSGHIINTASCGGLFPGPYQTAYASTKSAVITMTRCMAYEYDGTGVHFTQISPLNVATNIFSAQAREQLRTEGKSEAEIEKITAGLKPPEGAMSLDDALDCVFAGIENQEVDVIFGEEGYFYYYMMCTDKPRFDKLMLGLAHTRREYYDAIARGENVPFPG